MKAGSRLGIVALGITCFLSLAVNAILLLRAQPDEADRPLIEKAIASATAHTRSSEDAVWSRATPSVTHLPDRTCVELRSDGGRYAVCYDRHGEVIEQTMSVVN